MPRGPEAIGGPGQVQVGDDASKQMFFVFEPKLGDPVDEVTRDSGMED